MAATCFRSLATVPINPDGALIYLKLRAEECPKTDALRFARRLRCRSDTTKLTDGPISFDCCFPVKPTEHKKIVNYDRGWVKGNLSYQLGVEYEKVIEEQEAEMSNLKRLETHLEKMVARKQKKFKKNIANFKEFFEKETAKRLEGLQGVELYEEVSLS